MNSENENTGSIVCFLLLTLFPFLIKHSSGPFSKCHLVIQVWESKGTREEGLKSEKSKKETRRLGGGAGGTLTAIGRERRRQGGETAVVWLFVVLSFGP